MKQAVCYWFVWQRTLSCWIYSHSRVPYPWMPQNECFISIFCIVKMLVLLLLFLPFCCCFWQADCFSQAEHANGLRLSKQTFVQESTWLSGNGPLLGATVRGGTNHQGDSGIFPQSRSSHLWSVRHERVYRWEECTVLFPVSWSSHLWSACMSIQSVVALITMLGHLPVTTGVQKLQEQQKSVLGNRGTVDGGRVFFPRINFVCSLLFCVRSTSMLPQWRIRPWSFCQKCRVQATPKHAYTHDQLKSEWAN